MKKRFFECDDNGATYTFVAKDLDHAKQILADSHVELIAVVERDSPGVVPVSWTEISADDAATHAIDPYDQTCWKPDPDPERAKVGYMIPKVLADYDLGDWFSSEY